MTSDKDVKKLLTKVEQVTRQKEMDLSADEDLSIAIMNLISIEEHLFFTAQKTGKQNYLELLNEVRLIRAELLKRIIKDYEGEVWCFPAETIIFSNPEPKHIKEFRKDDKVLTHRGEFELIEKTYERNYKGDMTVISPYYSDPLTLTPGHEVLCATDVRKKQKDLWRKNFSAPNITWKKAEDVLSTDFLLFPRYLKEVDIEEDKLRYTWTNSGCFKPTTFNQERKIRINKDLIELIGFYLAEGSISEGRSAYKNSFKTQAIVYFSFGKHETRLIRRTQSLFEKVFKIPLKISETHTTIDLRCSHRIIVKFFKQFGTKSKEKRLPNWLINLPKEKLFPVLIGLIKGDGMVDKYQMNYFTCSEKLAYQLRILLFKLGVLHSLKKRVTKGGQINGRKINPSSGFEITISGDAARIVQENTGLKYRVKRTSGNFGYVLDDYIMIPLRKVDKINYSGKVYNLQTQAQTYTTFAGVVHNCISKHLLAASMRVMEVGTKELKKGNKKGAWELFKKAYQLYSLFWGINLKVVKFDNVKRKGQDLALIDEAGEKKSSTSLLDKLGNIVQKAIDCCKE